MRIVRGCYEISFNGEGGTVRALTPRAKMQGEHTFKYRETVEHAPRYIRDFISRMQRIVGVCYLLHFDEPYPNGKKPQHYLGFSQGMTQRELAHRAGQGAKLMQVVVEQGIDFNIVRLWPGVDKKFERMLKNKKNHPRLCPVCNPVLTWAGGRDSMILVEQMANDDSEVENGH